METRAERLERRLEESGEQISRRLKLAVLGILAMIFLILAALLFRYVQTRNEPPRSYYDFQLEVWRAEAARDPSNPRAHINLGYLYTKTGQANRARYEFDLALKMDEKNPVVWYYLGLLDKESGDLSAARKYLNKAVSLAGKGSKFPPLYELGKMYEKDKKYDKAIELYKLADADQPIIWNTHFRLGRLYEKKGQKDRALEEYKKAQQFNKANDAINGAIKRLSSTGD